MKLKIFWKKVAIILVCVSIALTMLPVAAVKADTNSAAPAILLAEALPKGKTSMTVSWIKLSGATKYVVYKSKSSKSLKEYKALPSSKNTITISNLTKNTPYKFKVVAYNGSKKLTGSKTLYNYTSKYKGKKDSIKSITANVTNISLKTGETKQLSSTIKTYRGKTPISHTLKYATTNKNIANVNNNGIVTAVSTGACIIYTFAANGSWTKTNITVTTASNPGLKKPVASVDQSKKYRVIMDGDIACEADDLYAVAYALMSPKLDVVGVCSEQFGTQWSKTSMEDGYQELLKLTDSMGIYNVPILRGATKAITDSGEYEDNEASRFIVQEALKDDDTPLVIVCTGTMTNVAIAYKMDPSIASHIRIIGNGYPKGGWTFNLQNDYNATNILMDSNIEWYMSDASGETSYKATLTSLHQRVASCGKVGTYLWNRTLWANTELSKRIAQDIKNGFLGIGLNDFELRGFVPNGEVFELNDLSTVARALSTGYIKYEYRDSEHINAYGALDTTYTPTRKIKVITNVTDTQCFMNDFYDKLAYNYGN